MNVRPRQLEEGAHDDRRQGDDLGVASDAPALAAERLAGAPLPDEGEGQGEKEPEAAGQAVMKLLVEAGEHEAVRQVTEGCSEDREGDEDDAREPAAARPAPRASDDQRHAEGPD